MRERAVIFEKDLKVVKGSVIAQHMKELRLPESLTKSLAAGHPWVYRDHIREFQAPAGTWVKVKAGTFEAFGIWDDESAIAVRIFSVKAPVDQAWINARIGEAYALRKPLRDAGVSGYRLVFGEADQFPGIVVDLYAGHAILLNYSKSLGSLVPMLAEAVMALPGILGVSLRKKQGDSVELRPLRGEVAPEQVVVSEYGMLLNADLIHGQKTGLFFDHRENRRFVGDIAAGKSVLNLFSYNGGFSIAALRGGAERVVSVDIAAPAVRAIDTNLELNKLDSKKHEGIAADVFDYLQKAKNRGEKFDLVVCDPPSFARNQEQRRAAEKAYRRVNSLAMDLTTPGGIFCAASCTSQIGPEPFKKLLLESARKSRVRFQIVREEGQPFDHPVSIAHEEGRYLKFVAGRVLSRV